MLYYTVTKEKALEVLERVADKWPEKYPNSMKSWKQNWDAILLIFKFSTGVKEGRLHDQCDRALEFYILKTKPSENETVKNFV